jgi:hypothetical protein
MVFLKGLVSRDQSHAQDMIIIMDNIYVSRLQCKIFIKIFRFRVSIFDKRAVAI